MKVYIGECNMHPELKESVKNYLINLLFKKDSDSNDLFAITAYINNSLNVCDSEADVFNIFPMYLVEGIDKNKTH